MNNINSLIQEVQEKADIVGIISKYITLNRKGNNYVGICPFHPDKNPSLFVSPKLKIFNCFVCGTKGNVFTFIQKYKNISFLEAFKEVALATGYSLDQLESMLTNTRYNAKFQRLYDLNKQVNDWFKGFLNNNENSFVLDYLNKRKMNKEIIDYFEFGYAPNDKDIIYRMLTNANNMFGEERSKDLIWNEDELLNAGLISISQDGKIIDFFINRLMLPIKDASGQIIGFGGRALSNDNNVKYLITGTTKIFNKGDILYNFHNIKELNPSKIYIVEGFMDVIAYHRAGIKNVVGLMGTALTTGHINLLKTISSLKTIILALDNDDAGKQAMMENAKKLIKNNFLTFVINYDNIKFKDADEIINNCGEQKLIELSNNYDDYITHCIKKQLNTNLIKIDELQIIIDDLLKLIKNYGVVAFKNKYLQMISEMTKLEIDDLKQQFDKISFKKTNKKWQKNKYFEGERELTNVDNDYLEPELININENKSINSAIIDLKYSLSQSLDRINNKLSYLILYMIFSHECIDRYQKSNLFSLKGFESKNTIISVITWLWAYEKPINIENILKILKEKSNLEKYKKACDDFEKIINNKKFYSPLVNKKYFNPSKKTIDNLFSDLEKNALKLQICRLHIQKNMLKNEEEITKIENELQILRKKQ